MIVNNKEMSLKDAIYGSSLRTYKLPKRGIYLNVSALPWRRVSRPCVKIDRVIHGRESTFCWKDACEETARLPTLTYA